MTPRQRTIIPAAEISAKNGYKLSDIIKPTKKSKIVRVRDEAIYEIWKKNSLSFNQIGQIFNKHHSSIYSSLGRHMNRSGIEHAYAEAYRVKMTKQLNINRKDPALNVAA